MKLYFYSKRVGRFRDKLMDHESLKVELQNQIDILKNKWLLICESEYGGDMKKLYNERSPEIFEDVKPIWEITLQMNAGEDRDKL